MQYRRIFIPGASYFFTINLLNRQSNLLIREIQQLRYAFQKAKTRYPFEMDGIVVLPDHMHMVLTLPSNDDNFSVRIRLIKSYFSYQLAATEEQVNSSRKNKNERGIWQRRFWEHLIRNESDYENHLNYIHYNPVKHGYVIRASDWAYSSIHRYIQAGILPANWACESQFKETLFGE